MDTKLIFLCRENAHGPAILSEQVERNILLIRGHRVMLDADLATLYGVPVKRLNEQVLRNKKKFPSDFMFQLTPEEVERLRSQFATLKPGRGQHRKYRPDASMNWKRNMMVNFESSSKRFVNSWRSQSPRLNESASEPNYCNPIVPTQTDLTS